VCDLPSATHKGDCTQSCAHHPASCSQKRCVFCCCAHTCDFKSFPDSCLQDVNYPVTQDLREEIHGGIFSTFNVLPMHSTVEGWFDQGLFCVDVSLIFAAVPVVSVSNLASLIGNWEDSFLGGCAARTRAHEHGFFSLRLRI